MSRPPRYVWVLVAVQVVIVAAYLYGVVALLVTDATSFPEHAPPSWSWPAVLATGVGYCPAAVCLMVAASATVMSPQLRTHRRQWPWLVGASAASAAMLLVMVTPPGWAVFDWYVG